MESDDRNGESRTFMMRTAVIGAATVMTGRTLSAQQQIAAASAAPPQVASHLVVTAPTGGSAGVLPALVYALGEGGRKLPQDKLRNGFLAAAAIGYLCKHNATLSGAEGSCQAEIGVASAMGAAFIAQAHDFPHDFDTTVDAMALTAKEMNAKYKETSAGGLAVSVTLC